MRKLAPILPEQGMISGEVKLIRKPMLWACKPIRMVPGGNSAGGANFREFAGAAPISISLSR